MVCFRENYEFFKQILFSSLKVETKLVPFPYENLSQTDNGLRKLFWSDFEYNDEVNLEAIQELPANQLIHLKSVLGFSTLVYRTPDEYGNDLLSIGPFLTEEPSNNFISEIIHNNNFPINFIRMIKTYYQTFPCIEETTIATTVAILLNHLIPEVNHIDIIKQVFTCENNLKFKPAADTTQQFSKKICSNITTIHNSIFAHIVLGNYEEASSYLNQYIQKTGALRESSLTDLKISLYAYNAKCEYTLLQQKVHSIYIKRVYANFVNIIKFETNRSRLLELSYEMTKKYSELITKYSLAEYTLTVRNTIDYINLHLDEPLSLSYLAEKLDKNNSFLSSQFKKEKKQTITDYIHQKRIEYATLLLNTTTLSIQEIASRVGIEDMSYFSKLFKKKTGFAPSEYKQMM